MLPFVLDRALSVTIVSSRGSVNVDCRTPARQNLRNEEAYRTNRRPRRHPCLPLPKVQHNRIHAHSFAA